MTISPKIRFEIFKRDDFTCQYCGRKTPEVILEIDHIIPVSKGGQDERENLTTSCYECNRGKGGNLLETILKDRNIHEETLLLAEKEMQLAEYNKIKEKIRERENRELDLLANHFSEQFYKESQGFAYDEFPTALARQALKVMSYVDIMEFIDRAVAKTRDDTRGDYHNVAAAKYLAATLRNRLRETNDSSA